MSKQLKPGVQAKYSGQYEILNSTGKATGVERTVVQGKPLPPTPKKGYSYRLADKTRH